MIQYILSVIQSISQKIKRQLQRLGRWLLFKAPEEESMAISRSSMGQQIARPPGKVVPNKNRKVETVMNEFKQGKLHSGKDGPVVKGRKQAVAIALSEARRAKSKTKKKGK